MKTRTATLVMVSLAISTWSVPSRAQTMPARVASPSAECGADSLSNSIADVSFGSSVPGKGAKIAVTSTFDMSVNLAIRVDGGAEQKATGTMGRTVAASAAVAECNDKGPTVVALEFAECRERLSSPAGASDEEAKWSRGKYTANGDAAQIAVTGPAKLAKLGKAEREVTRDVARPLFGSAPLAKRLAGKSFKLGETIEIAAADEALPLALLGDGFSVKSVKLTLSGERSESGVDAVVFKAAVELKQKAGDDNAYVSVGTVTMALAGDVFVAKSDCQILAAELSGPVAAIMEDGWRIQSKIEIVSSSGKATWKYAAVVR